MGLISTILNILWWIPGFGFVPAFILIAVGSIMYVTVVMAPFGLGLINLGKFYLAPFSRSLISQTDTNEKNSAAWDVLSTILFIIYLPIGIIVSGLFLYDAALQCLTIVGIPMAIPIIKSLSAIFNPIGKKCVSSEVKDMIDRKKARQEYRDITGGNDYSAYSSRTPSPVVHHHSHRKHKKNE